MSRVVKLEQIAVEKTTITEHAGKKKNGVVYLRVYVNGERWPAPSLAAHPVTVLSEASTLAIDPLAPSAGAATTRGVSERDAGLGEQRGAACWKAWVLRELYYIGKGKP